MLSVCFSPSLSPSLYSARLSVLLAFFLYACLLSLSLYPSVCLPRCKCDLLKREPNEDTSQALSIGMEYNTRTAVFSRFYSLVSFKSAFKRHKNTAMSTAILFPAVCVCDLMNKAGTFGRSVYYVPSGASLFLFFIGREHQHGCVLYGV